MIVNNLCQHSLYFSRQILMLGLTLNEV